MLILSADNIYMYIYIQKNFKNLHIRKSGYGIKTQNQFEFHTTSKETNKMYLTINIK